MHSRLRRFVSLLICGQLCLSVVGASTFTETYLTPQSAAQSSPEARNALTQGKALLRRGNSDQALGLLETALKLFQQSSDEKGAAAAHDALGDLFARQGQYNVALEHYQSSYTAFRSESDPYNANLMLAKIGDMNFRQGKNGEALMAYGQMDARKPNTDAFKTVSATRSKINKGRGLFDRVRGMASTTPSTSTASSATSLATDAASEVTRSFNLYRQFIIYATYELGLGRVDYANNSLDSAKTHFQNALEAAGGGDLPIIGKLGQTRRFRVAARTSLGDIALRQNRFTDAIKFYTDAASGAQSENRLDLIWPAQRGLGRSRILMAAQERDPQRALKLREDGIAAYREALKNIETIRAGSLRSDDARSTFLASTKNVYDEASSALAEMAIAAGGDKPLSGQALNYAAEGFRVAEQGRARSLLDLLAETGAVITEGVPPELLQRKQTNLDRQQEIAQILTGVNFSGEAPPKPIAQLEAELEQLSTENDQIENQIRIANPRYSTLTASQPLTIGDVQQQVLDDKTVLLEYSLGDENSYLWAVSPGGVTLHRLPDRAAINQQAIALRAQLIPAQLRRQIVGINVAASATGNTGSQTQRGLGLGTTAGATPASAAYAAAAYALYKTAVEPAAAMTTGKRLLIVADGALNYIPFEALVTSASTAGYDALPYLLKSNEVSYAPSASVIAAIRQQSVKAQQGAGLLLVADPVFDAGDPRARGGVKAAGTNAANTATSRGLALGSAVNDLSSSPTETPSGGLKLARLDGTRIEAQQIAQMARTAGKTSSLWLDLEASEANLKTKDIKSYRVVHVATHGLLDAERPQFSGLVLSLVGDEKGGDGFLRTDEIFNLRLGAPLVMLSACETGLGKEKRGEGVIGLTRAFMYAGAPTVGVSLWSVADRSTADLMTDFYKRLLAKTDPLAPSAALRAAQQNMIAGKKYSAPFYWAPFVLIGDWR